MLCRLAGEKDLPAVQTMFHEIVDHMNATGVCIWDDVYPCAFFAEDIANRELYLLQNDDALAAAFVLSPACEGDSVIRWQDCGAKAVYLRRFGVSAGLSRRGIGMRAVDEAARIARESGAQWLRLLVYEANGPAMRLYEKAGFTRGGGSFDLDFYDGSSLHEYGYELKL